MSEFRCKYGECPPIPDDLTIPQFLFDYYHPQRPLRPKDCPWLIEDGTGRTIFYEEIRVRTLGFANALHTRWGLGEDDCVCIFSPNSVDYPVAIWAIHRLGAVVTTANPSYTVDELAYQLSITKACLIITSPDSAETAIAAARMAKIPSGRVTVLRPSPQAFLEPVHLFSDLINEGLSKEIKFRERTLQPGEAKTKVAFMCFSSGTTGRPKAVVIPHYAVIANVVQMATYHKVNEDYTTWDKRRFRPGDVCAAVLPFYHIYGLVVNMHFLLFNGMTLVVVPKFNFVDFLKCIVRFKVTHLVLVPPQIVLLCKHPAVKEYDLSGVRFCISGAAPLSAELTRQLIKVIPNSEIGQGYGMTETCTTVTMVPIDQRIGTMGSAGRLMPGITARVLKSDGTQATYGEPGELIVSGPSLALRYANNEEATKETFQDGWVRTGDEVIIDRSGDVFVVDRLKEILKVRGFQVAPAELEGHLLDHPAVADACVVGVKDDYSGELPFAFVAPSPSAQKQIASSPEGADKVKQAIIKHVSDSKVQYKWLAGGVEFIDVIPKNPSGKLLRRLLRDKANETHSKRALSTKSKL